jgi:hypothetical protein
MDSFPSGSGPWIPDLAVEDDVPFGPLLEDRPDLDAAQAESIREA